VDVEEILVSEHSIIVIIWGGEALASLDCETNVTHVAKL